MQPDNAWTELFRTAVLPTLTLLATGLVGLFLNVLKKKLDENTALTIANKEAAATAVAVAKDTNNDQSRGWAELGKWRYEINEKLSVVDQRFIRIEQRLAEAHTERLVATMVTAQAVAAAQPVASPVAASVAVPPPPAAAPAPVTVNVNEAGSGSASVGK